MVEIRWGVVCSPYIDALEGLDMSFYGGVCVASSSKTADNGIDHTSNNTRRIFLLPLLAFSYNLLVIVAPASNVSPSASSSITAMVIVNFFDEIVYTSPLNQLFNLIL